MDWALMTSGILRSFLANENPWEFRHKLPLDQPGTAMLSSVAGRGTTQGCRPGDVFPDDARRSPRIAVDLAVSTARRFMPAPVVFGRR